MAFATEREQASMVVVFEGLGSDQQVGRGAKQVACVAPLDREVFEAKERTAGWGTTGPRSTLSAHAGSGTRASTRRCRSSRAT